MINDRFNFDFGVNRRGQVTHINNVNKQVHMLKLTNAGRYQFTTTVI